MLNGHGGEGDRPVSRALTRRTALTGVLAAPMISRFAHAAEFTWRFGHVAPNDAPLHRRMVEAAEAVAKRSEGRMEIRIIGEGQAGIQSGLFAQVRGGGLEMTFVSGAQLTPLLGLAELPSLGFLFDTYTKLWSAMDGAFGQAIREQIPRQVGVDVLEKPWDLGFRHVTTTDHAIRTAEDLKNLKIRTQIDEVQMDMFRSLDAIPVVITLPYLRAALEHRQLDGQEGILPLVEYARLQEVQKYCAMTRHAWDGFWVCVNPDAWKTLPERLRGIVANAMNGAAVRQREDTARKETSTRQALSGAGMTFTEVDTAGFRDMLRQRGYYARARAKFGEPVWDVVRKASGVTA